MLTRLHQLVHHRWVTSVGSGVLIVVALAAERLAGAPALGWAMMVAAAVIAGSRIAVRAVRGLAARSMSIELLVTVAAIGAVVIGEYWEAAAVTFLFAVGGALEQTTLGRTRRALQELLDLAPTLAVVVRDGEQVEVPAEQVRAGETVLVKNGAKVPVDGEVTDGRAAVDESSITGESIPVEKSPGAQVFAGSVSQGGFITVRATGVGADTTLARVIHRVEEAQEEKAKAQRFMDRFARWYTPAVMLLAVVAGLLTADIQLALTLLVIGCPGALVISMPVSIVAGIGRAAHHGILIKGGEHLERTAKVTAVALDKTGTLTAGRPRLTDLVPLGGTTEQELLERAALAEAGSEHPLARPVLEAAASAGLPSPAVPDKVIPHVGKGVEVRTGGRRLAVGSLDMLAELDVDLDQPAGTDAGAHVDRLAESGRTPMVVAVDDDVIGVLAVADQVRPDAADMVAALRGAGVRKVVMLTGDDARVARAVGRQTGVDDVRAGLLPEEKLEAVKALQRDGHVVAMVGDGVNDAPALAAADVGVSMGAAGSAVAVETADLALMSDNLMRLPQGLSLARLTVRNVRQNIAIAVTTVLVLLAGVLFGGVTMAIGMFVHQASVLIVIANGMRLLRATPRTVGLTHAQAQPAPAAKPRETLTTR